MRTHFQGSFGALIAAYCSIITFFYTHTHTRIYMYKYMYIYTHTYIYIYDSTYLQTKDLFLSNTRSVRASKNHHHPKKTMKNQVPLAMTSTTFALLIHSGTLSWAKMWNQKIIFRIYGRDWEIHHAKLHNFQCHWMLGWFWPDVIEASFHAFFTGRKWLRKKSDSLRFLSVNYPDAPRMEYLPTFTI